MNASEYQKFVDGIRDYNDDRASYERIASYDPVDMVLPPIDNPRLLPTRLMFLMVGLAGETGEVADQMLKWIYYGQPLDHVNLKEELGDALWYITKACCHLGITLEELMQSNHDKLKRRYPDGYSDYNAAERNRDRESERKALDAKTTTEQQQD